MEKDQLTEIIKDLRSKGLSFRAISKTLIEIYGVDLSHVSVREILKDSPEITREDAQAKNEETAPEVKPPQQIKAAPKEETSKPQLHIENNKESVNKPPLANTGEDYKNHAEWIRQRRRLLDLILDALIVGLIVLAFLLENNWTI